MRARRTPCRLELHRLRFQRDGRRGPLLRIEQLDPVEKEMIQQDLRAARAERVDPDERSMARTQAEVFAEWGVMCPHPNSSLDPISPNLTLIDVKNGKSARVHVCRCDACGASVFPRMWRIDLQLILGRVPGPSQNDEGGGMVVPMAPTPGSPAVASALFQEGSGRVAMAAIRERLRTVGRLTPRDVKETVAELKRMGAEVVP